MTFKIPQNVSIKPFSVTRMEDMIIKRNLDDLSGALNGIGNVLKDISEEINILKSKKSVVYPWYIGAVWNAASAPYKINDIVIYGSSVYISNIAANSDIPSTNYTDTPGTAGFSWTRYTSLSKVIKVAFDLSTGNTPGA